MNLSFSDKTVEFDGVVIQLPWTVLQVVEGKDAVYVLLNPDAYISDSSYRHSRRAGAPALKNLIAYSLSGQKMWESELPEESDYYYKIRSVEPLVASSFSSYHCEIEKNSGAILKKEFYK